MTSNFNYVKCPKCEHDRNPSTATKCEICGTSLRKTSSPIVLIGAGIMTVALLGTGAYLLKDKIPGFSTPPDVSENPTAITVAQPPSTPAPPQSSVAVSPNNEPHVQGAIVAIYHHLAEVPNVPQGLFTYGGSTVFAPLRSTKVVGAIQQAFPPFQLRYTEPTTGKPGSGKGIEMLIDGQLSVAQSSRAIKDEEYARAKSRGFSLEAVPVVIDGIALFVNPRLVDQGVKALSLAQVQAIFIGKIKNWREVGGPNLPITPLSRDPKTSSDFFHENVLEKQPLGNNVKLTRDATEAIRQVAINPGGISYATASEAINQRTIRLVAIAKASDSQNFVSPCADATCATINEKAFADGAYPITRRLFVILKRDGRLDEQAGVAYANMLLSDEGQKLAEQAGFVPIR